MDRHQVEFLESVPCGSEIASFRFGRPSGYDFIPGQHLMLRIPTADGPQVKPFTISSAPHDPYLEITTRLSGSAFKNGLLALESGSPVEITGAAGKLTLPPDARCVRFLVGGVGITPARSMLRDAAHRGVRWDDVVLFFGNRDESCIPFLDEFEAMRDGGVRVISVLERATGSWSGRVGFITADIVREEVDARHGLFIASGPPVMVAAMERVLDDLGVDGDRRMIEWFGRA